MQEWQEQALCREVDPDLFVPDGPDRMVAYKYAKAIQVCQSCPVIEDCREYALTFATSGHIYGVWGGMRPQQLITLARERKREHRA